MILIDIFQLINRAIKENNNYFKYDDMINFK